MHAAKSMLSVLNELRRRSARAPGGATVLLALGICSPAIAQIDQRCTVEHAQGQNGATISVRMTVVNDGRPCMMQRRFKGRSATSLTVREQPAHGTLSNAQSQVSYTPKPGFVGTDAFDVEWFGVGFGPNARSRSIRTKVEVTVLVADDEPDAAGNEPQAGKAKPTQ